MKPPEQHANFGVLKCKKKKKKNQKGHCVWVLHTIGV